MFRTSVHLAPRGDYLIQKINICCNKTLRKVWSYKINIVILPKEKIYGYGTDRR